MTTEMKSHSGLVWTKKNQRLIGTHENGFSSPQESERRKKQIPWYLGKKENTNN